jgi:hypothetical protein
MRVSTEEARDAAATWQGRLERIGRQALCVTHSLSARCTRHVIARCGIEHKPAFRSQVCGISVYRRFQPVVSIVIRGVGLEGQP